MKENRENISWKEVYALNKRALCLWCRECPMLFVSSGLHAVISALIPYLTLYFSARLLDELAGMRRTEVLTQWVIILLASDAAAYLAKALMFRWKEALRATLYYRGEERLSRKMLDMDFASVDDVATHHLLSQIRQRERWSGWGADRIYRHFESMVEEMFRIFGAAALTVSLFRLPVRQEAGWLTLLNSPFCILVLLFLMFGIATLAPYLSTRGEMRVLGHDESMKFGNRIYFFLVSFFQDEKRALDMRTYRQDLFGIRRMEEILDPETGILHEMERDARGKMGGLFMLSAAVSRSFIWFVYLFVCLKAWGGAFGIGSVTQYVGAVMSFSKGLSGVLKVLGEMKVNSDTLKKFFAFLDIPNEMYQGSLTVEKRSDRKYEIEFRNVSFRYPHTENYVLKNVSLKFKVGERLAVVGQNGSGKTTTIDCILQLLSYDKGEISLFGQPMAPTRYDLKRRLGVVPQNIAVFDELTVRENIDYFCGLYVTDKARRAQCVEAAIEFCGLEDFTAWRPKRLSGGLLRRLNIACGIAHKPDLAFFDEPTVAVDAQSRAQILEGIRAMNQAGATVVYTSHYMEEVEELCDRVAILDHGHIIAAGTVDELKAQGKAGETISVELPELPAGLTDKLKAAMVERGTEALQGDGWKATWKNVNGSRFDSKAFKADHADLYGQYSKTTTARRFCVA